MRFIALLLALAFASNSLADQAIDGGGRVCSVYFDTSCQMPVFSASPENEPVAKSLQWVVGNAPEGVQLTTGITLLAKQFSLNRTQARALRTGFGEAYEAINTDPQCEEMPSALDEIFATDPERKGHYFVYVPPKTSVTAPTIVFLHGYGGNLKFYIWALKVAFPNSAIIAPTWGIGWHNGDVTYVDEVCRDVETRFGLSLANKWLMGLSAGGPTGFRVMSDKRSDYLGYVCIASGLNQQRVASLAFAEPVLMLNGKNDVRFPIEFVRRSAAKMKKHGVRVEQLELDSDHFFLLTDRGETLRKIESFIEKHSPTTASLPKGEKANRVVNWSSLLGLLCLVLAILGLVSFSRLRAWQKK